MWFQINFSTHLATPIFFGHSGTNLNMHSYYIFLILVVENIALNNLDKRDIDFVILLNLLTYLQIIEIRNFKSRKNSFTCTWKKQPLAVLEHWQYLSIFVRWPKALSQLLPHTLAQQISLWSPNKTTRIMECQRLVACL